MTVTVTKSAFNLREALNALKQKTGIKGLELLRSNDVNDVYTSINPIAFKNRIHNGGMAIDQRYAGNSQSNATFGVDRWQTVLTGISGLTTTSQQVADAPPGQGFSNSYKLTVSSAATAYNSGGRCGILQRIEGYNIADFGFGGHNAKSIALSFWVKSSIVGTYSVAILNNDSTRAYPALYQINSANSWEYKTIIIPPELSGTWLNNSGRGFQVEFTLGTDVSRQGDANVWNSDFRTATATCLRFTDFANATFFLTGVQLEKGDVCTPFEHRPFSTELALCQRYFQKTYHYPYAVGVTSDLGAIRSSGGAGNYNCIGLWQFKVSMRAAPTVTGYSTATGTAGRFTIDATDSTALGIHSPSTENVEFHVNNQSVGVNSWLMVQGTASAEL